MNIVKMMIPKSMTVHIYEDSSVRQGMEVISRHGFTAIPVLDGNDRYVGSVAEGDILRYLVSGAAGDVRDLERRRVKDIIRKDFCPAISIDADPEAVIDAILEQNFVPVVDSRGALCGIVTRRRLIAYYAGREIPIDPA